MNAGIEDWREMVDGPLEHDAYALADLRRE